MGEETDRWRPEIENAYSGTRCNSSRCPVHLSTNWVSSISLAFCTRPLISGLNRYRPDFRTVLPDARLPNRWEEVRIEFEYESRSFSAHGHDPNGVDVIVCWRHNWKECPKEIEVIELSTLLGDAEQIDTQIKTEKKLTAWQAFCQEKRLEGVESFAEIAQLWKERKQ